MRLGDDVDDYCSRCKRLTDHSVVSLTGEDVGKVRCRTCNYEHTFRKGKGGRKEMTKQEAFDRVLASVMGTQMATPKDDDAEKPKKSRSRRT